MSPGRHSCPCLQAVTAVYVSRQPQLSMSPGSHCCLCLQAVRAVYVSRQPLLFMSPGSQSCLCLQEARAVYVSRQPELSMSPGSQSCLCLQAATAVYVSRHHSVYVPVITCCRCLQAARAVYVSKQSQLSMSPGSQSCLCLQEARAVYVSRQPELSMSPGSQSCLCLQAVAAVYVSRQSLLSMSPGSHSCLAPGSHNYHVSKASQLSFSGQPPLSMSPSSPQLSMSQAVTSAYVSRHQVCLGLQLDPAVYVPPGRHALCPPDRHTVLCLQAAKLSLYVSKQSQLSNGLRQPTAVYVPLSSQAVYVSRQP